MSEERAAMPDVNEKIALMNLCDKLLREYNNTPESDISKRDALLSEILGGRGERLRIRTPFNAILGRNIFLGENCYINMNCTLLDDDTITIGGYSMLAPDVKIYTAFHPMTGEERWSEKCVIDGFEYPITHTRPVRIGRNVWIGGGSVILPGVTIGDNCVIGAGSVVTKDIPSNSVAYGSPCRVVRENV
ncbi:MAG: sugar O-acetyltransferase [Synergistaceae bacterium]